MKTVMVPIDLAGWIVLPKSVRQELAIQAGDHFQLTVQGETVTLTPSRPRGGFVRQGKALVFETGGKATLSAETVQEIREAGRAGRDSLNLAGLR